MEGKHTFALYDHLKSELKPLGKSFLEMIKVMIGLWLDMGEIIVHLMTPAYRQKYSIEEFLSSLKKGV